MYEDDPQDRVFDVLGKAIFGSHPLGRAVIGTAEVVGAVTREQLAAFHAQRYLPHSIVVAAAGSVDHDALVQMPIGDRPAASSAAVLRHGACPEGAPAGSTATRRRPPRRTSARARASCRKTPSSTTCASAARGSRATTSAASRCACSKACSAGRPPRGSSRRCASAGGWPTRCSPSPTSTPTRARSGCTWARARRTSGEALAVVAAELERCVEDPASEEELMRSRENLKGRVVLAHGVDRRAHEPPWRLGAQRAADPVGRRDDRADRRGRRSTTCARWRPSCSRRAGCRRPASGPEERSSSRRSSRSATAWTRAAARAAAAR